MCYWKAGINLKLVSYKKSHSLHVSKVIHAPLRFVYDWCTDYRETDALITGSKAKRKILMKTKHRVVYVVSYRRGDKTRSAVDVVTLYPPNAWHLDFVGDEDDETGDYVLSSLGPKKTRLDMAFTEHYKVEDAPSRAEDTKHIHEIWDKYVRALEKDYARKR